MCCLWARYDMANQEGDANHLQECLSAVGAAAELWSAMGYQEVQDHRLWSDPEKLWHCLLMGLHRTVLGKPNRRPPVRMQCCTGEEKAKRKARTEVTLEQ